MKKIKVTVGIPVFNEQENICFLISDILSQKISDIKLNEILIVSDGSTDGTVARIQQLNNRKVRLISNYKRMGVAVRQNQIFAQSHAWDYLILLNGDIRIKDKEFFQKTVGCATENKADLLAIKLMPANPVNFFERILKVSVLIKGKAFEKYKNGDNLFTCCGPARIFSKKLFQKIKFKESPDEDAYSYLFCKYYGFRYKYFKGSSVYYLLPSNLRDHKRQSTRFFNQKHLLESEFGVKYVRQNYVLPYGLFILSGIITFLSYPLETISYFCLVCAIKAESFIFKRQTESTWEIASSTKHMEPTSY